MLRSIFKSVAIALAGSALLAACGGGGGSTHSDGTTTPDSKMVPPGQNNADNNTDKEPPILPQPNQVIAGVFDDTSSDSSRPLTILLQNDGSYFIVYSDASPPPNAAGVVLGTGALNSGSFSSTDGLDLSLVGIGAQDSNPVTLSASYSEKSAFSGSISYTGGSKTTSFAGVYNNRYETLPDLPAVAGVYKGSIATRGVREDNIELTITASGDLSGQLTCGCSVGAMLKKRTDHPAYYATLAFKGGDNPLSDKSFVGNVYFDTATSRIYIVGNVFGKTNEAEGGAIFVGTKS